MRGPLAVVSLCVLASCGGGVPATFPQTSPAGLSAPEARRAIVTASLQGDVPLPGEQAPPGWPGLGAAPAASAGSMHHHHDMPMSGDAGAPAMGHGEH